jgi:hypothetical protein
MLKLDTVVRIQKGAKYAGSRKAMECEEEGGAKLRPLFTFKLH